MEIEKMQSILSIVPEIADATPEEKLAMIDELWEMVRRSGHVSIPESHLNELDQRLTKVLADPSLALAPDKARAQFRK